jgi:ribosomal protein L16 Arg81 hydroxylase
MNVESLLGNFGLTKFVAEYLHRLPLALPKAAAGTRELGSWSTLARLLENEDAAVLVVRDGQPQDLRPADVDAARQLSAAGYTIVVRHAERHDAPLRELARSFERTFAGPVDVQFFVTPAGQRGFSWHYDPEDVFILQTAGSKQYGLRKNTVNPWPLTETLPEDMRYEREIMPLMSVSLAAGDMLYVPCGYWHKADASASTEAAISLAVGVMSRTAVDVFDSLRRRVVDSLLWRQRLPVAGDASPMTAEELEQVYRDLFAQLGADLMKLLRDERQVRYWLRSPDSPSV